MYNEANILAETNPEQLPLMAARMHQVDVAVYSVEKNFRALYPVVLQKMVEERDQHAAQTLGVELAPLPAPQAVGLAPVAAEVAPAPGYAPVAAQVAPHVVQNMPTVEELSRA